MAFVTQVFDETATLIARAERLSSVPRFLLPHTLASIERAERAVIAQAHVDETLATLGGGA